MTRLEAEISREIVTTMSRKRLKIQTRMFTTRTEMGTQIRKIIRKKSYQVLVVEREAHVCPGTELISDDESSAAGVGLRCLPLPQEAWELPVPGR